MRINKFVALASGLSRRKADELIARGTITVNDQPAKPGEDISDSDTVKLGSRILSLPETTTTIMLNKPVGYVVSRDGQGSKTIYELLPATYSDLKPVGRLDKDSSGLLLLTNDGSLAHNLTHPSKQKTKVYEITLDKPLQPLHHQMINDHGIQLEDGRSKLQLARQTEHNDTVWVVTMHEGRNRQIRRTFQALGYRVIKLNRTQFGSYQLGILQSGSFLDLDTV